MTALNVVHSEEMCLVIFCTSALLFWFERWESGRLFWGAALTDGNF